MSVINATPLLAAAGGDYQISRSVRLRSSASAYFNRTPASAGNRKTWTLSKWVKRGALGTQQMLMDVNGGIGGARGDITFLSGDTLQIEFNSSGSSWDTTLITTQVFRDPSAWYHIVIALDTTQATAANRLKLYVNGNQVTTFGTTTYPTQNVDQPFNTTSTHNIGRISAGGSYLDGYLTEINFIDGQALTPSSFGETDSITGVWKPKKYAGTYGTNGFYLNFSDNSAATAAAIGKDNSGNGNNWTPNNISLTSGVTYDSMIDVPTLYADGNSGRGNYCTLNPISTSNSPSIANGNLQTTTSGSSVWKNVQGTVGVSSGKWYWETTISGGSLYYAVGVAIATKVTSTYDTGEFGIWMYDGRGYKVGEGGSNSTAYGSTYTSGDVIGVALDSDAGTITFYKNNVSQGVAFTTGLAGVTVLPQFGVYYNGSANTQIANFGQRPFAYTPPTGFKALNTQNLPEPTIKKGNQYFDVSTWTGNGGTQSIVNSGAMQPNFVWIKRRQSAANHALYDSSRTLGVALASNSTGAEGAVITNGLLTAYNSNGFSVAVVSGDNATNELNGSFVGWQWKESASAGFDIVTYTGTGANRTVAHSLGVAPRMIIIKIRSSASDWVVYHADVGNTKYLQLSTTAAAATASTVWNNTTPTSTVFSLGSSVGVNQSTSTYVAYLFAEVAGFSKFGSYTGNGSTDGPFVFTGFRPRYVMIKRTDAIADWQIMDTARSANNVEQQVLYANTSAAEANYSGTDGVDGLSNGFKIRVASSGNVNASGATYIYAAFAESPFKTSLAR